MGVRRSRYGDGAPKVDREIYTFPLLKKPLFSFMETIRAERSICTPHCVESKSCLPGRPGCCWQHRSFARLILALAPVITLAKLRTCQTRRSSRLQTRPAMIQPTMTSSKELVALAGLYNLHFQNALSFTLLYSPNGGVHIS